MQSVPRLFETFVPEHYDLNLTLNRQTHSFNGSVIITGNHLSTQDPVRLHAKDLVIDKVHINKHEIPFALVPEHDFLEITPEHGSGSDIQVVVDFHGSITDAMHGLYPCYYEVEGEKKELFATQFESHHAREVFPCVDEPEAKATFNLTLATEPKLTALSNMPASSTKDGITIFETTPRMSPYLLAFVVGELHAARTKTKDGVDVAVWATAAQPPETLAFALDVAKRSIEFFNDYFGVPYPLPKCDHVALPDFSSGAMENWGLITYREICLLVDKNSAITIREYVATVIAHETSHQWFGNLVTMKWWDDLWLNESFATLMEYICVDALFPDWKIWMNFATHEVLSAQRRDFLPGVQAIKTTVNHPDEISTLFDPSIVYAKGARVLAMLRQYIGADTFQHGLKGYFEEHQYKNTVADDLWASLSNDKHPDIGSFMKPWLEQSGMPVVRADLTDEKLTLTQSRFLIPADSSDTQLWPIPLGTVPSELSKLLYEHSDTIEYPENDAVWLNHGATTHMVSDYDDNLRARLYRALDDGNADEIDRLTLLHDTSLVMRAGGQNAVKLMELTSHYKNEVSEPVWDIVSLTVGDLRRLVDSDEEAEIAYKQQVAELAVNAYDRLGWDAKPNEHESDTKLRATILGLMTYAEHSDVLAEGLRRFHETTQPETLDGELRPLIFTIAVKHGSDDDRSRLLKLHSSTQNSELQNDVAGALCSSRKPEFIAQLISYLKDEKVVRRQDLFRWYYGLLSNRYGREQTWQWLLNNWSWIKETFGGDKSYDDFARYSASALTTPQWLARYKEFFADKSHEPALKRAIELGIADIASRADWYERDATDFCQWLTRSEAN